MATYELIRNIIKLILIILLIVFLIKCKNKSFHYKFVGIILTIFIGFLFSLPFENIFIKFHSVEDVFNYTQNGTIIEVIENSDSCLVIYKDEENVYRNCIIPQKGNTDYYIPSIWTTSKISEQYNGHNHYYISNVSNTTDYYLIGCITRSEKKTVAISDNINSNIYIYSRYNDITDSYDHCYYAKIDGQSIYNYSLEIT